MNSPTVYVLMPVYNRRALTERYVRCLASQTYRALHLVLIDDGSTDGTSEAVQAIVPDTTVIRGRGQWWWAGGLQQGIDHLRAQRIDGDAIVLMTNDDLTIPSHFVERGVELMESRTRTLVLAQAQSTDGSSTETGRRFDVETLSFTQADAPDRVTCLSTQGLFLRWKDIEAIGDFHPRALPHYLSDYEYTIRARRKGFALETSPALLIVLNRETTGFHRIEERRFVVFLRKFFSVKSPANPFYWSSFILLACPPRLWPRHLFVLWRNSIYRVWRAFVDSVKHARADRTVRL